MSDMETQGINRHALKLRSPFRHASNKYIPLERKQQFILAKEVWDQFGSLQTGVERIADYAVTGIDIILDDEKELGNFKTADSARDAYKELYETILDVPNLIKKIIVNQRALGSAFPYYGFTARKKAYCPVCEKRAESSMKDQKKKGGKTPTVAYTGEWLDSLDEKNWKYSTPSHKPTFRGKCPKCNNNVKYGIIEEKVYTKHSLELHLLDITRIDMDWIPITNKRRYWYNPDKRTKNYVSNNDKWAIANVPLQVLEAIAVSGRVELREGTFFHIEDSTIAQSSVAWPMPTILRAFFSLFYIASLRAASESIAATQITPFTVVWPQDMAAFQGKPGGLAFQRFRSIMEQEHKAWAENPKHIWISPIPITFSRIGGDGKMMLPTQEMQYAWDDAFLAIGIPRGLLTGNITWAGNHIAMRIFQNGVGASRTLIQRFINILQGSVQANLRYLPKAKIKLKPFKELDDAWFKQLAMQMQTTGVISNQKLCEIFDFDHVAMEEQVKEETKRRAAFESKLQMKRALDEAKANMEYQNTMAAEQSGLMLEQAQQHSASIVGVIKDLHLRFGMTVDQAVQTYINYQNLMMQQQEMDMMRMQQQQAQQTFLDKEMASAGQSINRMARGRSLYGMMGQDPTMPGGQPPASASFVQFMQAIDPAMQQQMMGVLSSVDPTLHIAVQGALGMPNPTPVAEPVKKEEPKQ